MMDKVVNLIIERAITQHKYTEMYSELCKLMIENVRLPGEQLEVNCQLQIGKKPQSSFRTKICEIIQSSFYGDIELQKIPENL